MIVLDASVVLKWMLQDEPGAPDALEWRERHLGGLDRVAVPELLFYEVANAMVFSGRLTEEQAAVSWEGLLAIGLDVYAVWTEAMPRVMELARAANGSVYDACYVVLAELLGCDFLTADRKLANQLAGVELHCAVRTL